MLFSWPKRIGYHNSNSLPVTSSEYLLKIKMKFLHLFRKCPQRAGSFRCFSSLATTLFIKIVGKRHKLKQEMQNTVKRGWL